ncbi:MAG: TonB family protein [Candidatus Synoicihabitans palmerolidicus]|nr:TonB family protein [Candidatus Synoicihabitans palmerolidicus]
MSCRPIISLLVVSLTALPGFSALDPRLDEPLGLLESANFAPAVPPLVTLAEAGEHHAMLLLALLHFPGAGVELDRKQARQWLERAAHAGNRDAIRELHPVNDSILPGQPDPATDPNLFSVPSSLARRVSRHLQYRYLPAIAWNMEHAATGSSVALYNLSRYTELAPNLVESARTNFPQRLKRAAEAGSLAAMRELSEKIKLQTQGFNTPEDKFARMTLNTADRGAAKTMFNLASKRVLAAQSDPSLDREEAIEWLHFAADKGHRGAINTLLTLEEQQDKVTHQKLPPLDSSSLQASNQIDSPSLAELVAKVKHDESIGALGELSRRSHHSEEALVAYAQTLLTNPDQPLARPDNYLKRLETSYANGNIEAGRLLARLQHSGRVDQPPNRAAARTLLEDLAESGDHTAQVELMASHFHGSGQAFVRSEATVVRDRYAAENPGIPAMWNRLPGSNTLGSSRHKYPDLSPMELAHRHAVHADRKGDAEPIVVFQPPPTYPLEMSKAGITGTVRVEFVVDSRGDPTNLKTTESTHEKFESAALEAVTRWRFAPALRNGKPINITLSMSIPIVFNITDD